MALGSCPECGGSISSKAPSCPVCGFPLRTAPHVLPPANASLEKPTAPQKRIVGCLSCLAIGLALLLLVVLLLLAVPLIQAFREAQQEARVQAEIAWVEYVVAIETYFNSRNQNCLLTGDRDSFADVKLNHAQRRFAYFRSKEMFQDIYGATPAPEFDAIYAELLALHEKHILKLLGVSKEEYAVAALGLASILERSARPLLRSEDLEAVAEFRSLRSKLEGAAELHNVRQDFNEALLIEDLVAGSWAEENLFLKEIVVLNDRRSLEELQVLRRAPQGQMLEGEAGQNVNYFEFRVLTGIQSKSFRLPLRDSIGVELVNGNGDRFVL